MTATIDQPISVRSDDVSTAFFLDARRSGSLAWDIETTGLDWKSDRIGTVQLALVGGASTVIQIRHDYTPTNLVTLLEMPNLTKIFHHAPFDLRFMVKAWRVKPRNVGCTKVLSKILHPERKEHSLKALLSEELGVQISKSSVRTSDWAAESLSGAQVEYATGDVLYLHALFDSMMTKAIAAGVAGAVEASFSYLPIRVLTDIRGCGDVFDY